MDISEKRKNIIKRALDSVSSSYKATKKHKQDFHTYQKRAATDKKFAKHYQGYADKANNLKGRITGRRKKLQQKADFYNMGAKVNTNRSNKAMNKVTGTGFSKAVTGTVAAAAASTAALLIYKRYMSKAAKACAGRKGDVRKLCLKAYKAKAPKK